MADIIIRKLTEDDIISLAELYRIFWDDDQNIEKMKIKFAELKNNDKYIFLCATIDNHVVGTIMGIICDELYGNCKPFLVMDDLVVHNNFRNLNIGTLLLNELEIIGKNNECSQIIFITDSNRKGTVSFYEKLGFNSKTHVGYKRKLK